MPDFPLRPGCASWQNRTSYTECLRLTRSSWAWEFLRRNPHFQKDLRLTSTLVKKTAVERGLQFALQDHSLMCWGAIFRNLP